MKIKTFILTFLMMMSCPFLFGQSELARVRNYGELSEAISNGSPKIQLSNDIAVSESLTIQEGVIIELDLNGWGLIAPEGTYAITNLGTLTIKDGYNGNGTIMSRGILNGSSTVATASLTIHSGIYKGIAEKGGAAVYSYGAVTIDGGKFYGKQAAIVCKAGSTMSIDCDATENQVLIIAEGKKNIAIINEIGESLSIAGETVIVGTIDERTEYEEGYDQPFASVEESVIFAKAKANDKYYEELAEAFAASNDGDEIEILAAGVYNVPTGKDVTITGVIDGVVFDMPKVYNGYITLNAGMTFNNVTFQYGNFLYVGLAHSTNNVYNNCTFNGQVFLYGESETFNNCTFNQTSSDAYNVWTYGAEEVAFNGCTFNSAGKSVLIYTEDSSLVNDVEVANCEFKASQAVEGKAAIEMDSSLSGGINLTIDGETTATGFAEGSESGNSLWNNKKGNEGANNDITVTVDGEVVLKPIYRVVLNENNRYETLQEAINACTTGDNLITLVDNIKEDVTVEQAIDVKICIDGQDKTMTGTITVDGKSARYETAALTIKNVKFDATAALSYDVCIRLGNGTNPTRYTDNVTVENCTFTGDGGTIVAIKSYTGGDHNLVVKGCKATGMHSLAQLKNVETGLKFIDCEVDCARGIALGCSQEVEISGCTIVANEDKYGVRADANAAIDITIKDTDINAFIPVVVREAKAASQITFSGENNFEAQNNDNLWCAIGTSEYEKNGVMPTPATGHVVVDLQDKNLLYDGVYGNYFVAEIDGVKYPTVAAAIGAVEAGKTIVIVDNAQGDESAKTVETDKAFTIDGYAPDYKFPVIKSSADITVKTLNTNNHITTLNNLNMVVDGGNLRINNSVVGGAFEVNAVMSLNNSYLSGTIKNNNRINVTGSSNINATSKVEGHTVTLVNNGVINVTGEAKLNIAKLSGNAIVLNNGTLADSYIGGRVDAFGTNNITGETTIDGILGLGYETNPTEQVVVNITGKFNGENVIVRTNNGVDNLLNVGTAEGERTIAHFGQLGAFGDVNINNADVTYGYTFVRNDFDLTNSTMKIEGGVNTYMAGNAKVVVDNSTWTLPGYANIGSYGGYMFGNADVTLTNGSVMTGTKLGIEVGTDNEGEGNKYVVNVTLDKESKLVATGLSNQATIDVLGKSRIEGKLTNNGIVKATGESVLAIENAAASTGNYILNNFVYTAETTLPNANIVFEGKENSANDVTFGNNTLVQAEAELHITTEATAEGEIATTGIVYLDAVDAKFTAKAGLNNVKSGVETYHVVYSNGAYILHPFSDYVAYIYREAGNAYFESFPQALDAANDGETITVITDGTIYLGSNKSNDLTNKTITITSEKTVKVDYNNRSLNVGKDATVIFDAIKLVPANDGNTHNNKFNVKEGGKIEFINSSDATVDFIAVNTGGIVNVKNSYVAVQKLFADDATYEAINVTGTSDIKVEAVENGSVVNMKNVTLSDATSLATGVKVVFNTTEENVNTVVKSNLKSVEFNGKTTLDAASLTGTINVKEGAEVDFTNNTYLNTTGGTESVTVAGTLNINKSGAWVRTIAVTGTLNVTGRNTIVNNYLGENDLYVRTTLTNNGAIKVNNGAIVTIGSASTTGKLEGTGALTIADNAEVYASNVAKENITSKVYLSGDKAKFFAPKDLTNVADVDGYLEPLYENGYYTLSGMYVAQIEDNQYRTIASALEAVQAGGTITLINNTTENVVINKSVKFNTIEAGVVITGDVTISNTVTVVDNANLTVEGTLTNDANLIVAGTLTTTTLNNETTGVITNNGTIAAATFVNEKTFTNNSSLTATTLTNSGTIINKGTLDVLVETTSGNTTTYSGSIANTEPGIISNYGRLEANVFTSNAKVYLYANSSVWVQQTANEVPGSFIVNDELTLGDNTRLNKAIITIAKSYVGTINGANLEDSKLTAVPGATLNVEGNLNIASLELQHENLYGYVKSTANVNGTLTVGELTNNANLNVKANAKLLITTKLTNENSGTITNEGELTANSNGIVNNGTLTNSGTLTATTITNSGTITNAAGKSLTVNATLTNSGTLTNNGTLNAYSLVNTGTLTNNDTAAVTFSFTNDGNIEVESGATFKVGTPYSSDIYNNGTIDIAGNFETNTNNWVFFYNAGKIDLSGTLSVEGYDFYNGYNNTEATVNVTGNDAIIYIQYDVYDYGTFNMSDVNLTSESMLKYANVKFAGTNTIAGATLTNSNLIVGVGASLSVTSNLALGSKGTLTNNGTLVGDANLSGSKLENGTNGIVSIQSGSTAGFATISNNNEIKVLSSTLKATSSFTNNGIVEVKGKSQLKASVNGSGSFVMNEVNLDGETVLTGANIEFNDTDNQVTSSNLLNSTVTVKSGAALTLNGATTGDITNNGTINLTGEVHAGDVTNNGTIKMETDDTEFYTPTEGLEEDIVPCHTGDDVVYNSDDHYYYINNEYVAQVGETKYALLQDAIDAAADVENNKVTIIANNITEDVIVSANTRFVLDTEKVTAATINGKLTVEGTATFNCTEIQFTNVDLNAAATMNIEGGNFEVTSIATKGQNVKVYVAETATLAMNVLRVQHSGASFVFNGQVDIARVIADNSTNPYTIELNAHDAKLVTATTGLNVETTIGEHRVSYKAEHGWYQLVNTVVAKFNGIKYVSLAAALDAVPVGSNNGIIELVWEEGNDPIVMTGVLSGKNATIKAAEGNHSGMVVDWSKGRLYVGRKADNNNGDATLTFDGVKFTSLNDGGNGENGIYVSTRVKNTEHYRGTLNIVNSTVEISSIYTQYVTNINNSTVKFLAATGMNVSGVNASYSPTGSATVSKLFVNNSTIEANNVLVGNLGEGYMLVDVTVDTETLTYTPDADDDSEITVNSTLDVLAGGTLWSAANIKGTITNAGTIQLCGGIYTMQPQESWCAENYGAFQLPDYTWIVRETGGTQSTEFAEGWHWYSTYIDEIELGDVQDQLSDYASQIKSQFAFTTNFGGGSWSTGGLNTFSPAEMYMINVAKPGTLVFEGDFVDYSNTDIELQKNWNWIGYPVNIEVNVNVALANLQPEVGDQIKGKNGFAVYRGETIGWMPNNLTLVPGNGYMYNSNSDAAKTFVYNAIEAEEETETRATEVKRWNADATQYPSNMTMIAMVSMDGEVVNSNYEVAAFANGELRGSARPVYVEDLDAYMLFLSINGNEVEELTFKYYDVNYGTEYVLNNTINYSNDAIVGSIDEPYMLNLDIMNIDEAATSEISIYPNPTTTDVEINLNATCDTVEVFNALGVKVAEYSNVDSIDALETAGVYVIRITNDGNVQNCRLVVK